MDDKSRLVIIKRYMNLSEAYIDQGMLEANGIQSAVGNPGFGSMFPALDLMTLSVEEGDLKSALELVPDSSINGGE